jgi:hypothetical protein
MTFADFLSFVNVRLFPIFYSQLPRVIFIFHRFSFNTRLHLNMHGTGRRHDVAGTVAITPFNEII